MTVMNIIFVDRGAEVAYERLPGPSAIAPKRRTAPRSDGERRPRETTDQRAGQPLTPPAVRPPTSCFCSAKKRVTTGKLTRIAAAAKYPHSLEN